MICSCQRSEAVINTQQVAVNESHEVNSIHDVNKRMTWLVPEVTVSDNICMSHSQTHIPLLLVSTISYVVRLLSSGNPFL